MNGMRFCLASLVVALLGSASLRAQDAMKYAEDGSIQTAPATEPTTSAPTAPPGPMSLSNWMLYPRTGGCCGPIGCDGPIGSEVYIRSGVNLTLNTGGLSSALNTGGWEIEGGARVLFFNPAADAAWVVDLGLSNIHQNGSDHTRTFPFQISVPNPNPTQGAPANVQRIANVSISALNRTYVNASLGREWYLDGTAECRGESRTWRAGVDLGGRWGTTQTEFNEIQNRQKVLGTLFLAVHSDIEIPCGNCIYQFGARAEYGYTWGSILQRQNDGDLQDISLLVTAGLRF